MQKHHKYPMPCIVLTLQSCSCKPDPLQAHPDGFHARFTIAFATQKATELRDQPQHLIEPWESVR